MESNDVSTHPGHDDLVLHHYGEAGAAAAAIDRHLASCAGCRASQAHLQQALALIEASSEGEPAAGYEATMWARLQDHLEPAAPWWRRAWEGGVARWALAASMATVAAVAFYAGSQTRDGGTVPATGGGPAQATATAPADTSGRSRLLDMAIGDHLDRAQLVLSEVTNGDGEAAPLAGERLRATDLVATNRLVRQTATLSGDESVDTVLDDLERALVEIANAPDTLDTDDWAALKARIDTQGLLFRVRVMAAELRARQQPAPTLRKGPTS